MFCPPKIPLRWRACDCFWSKTSRKLQSFLIRLLAEAGYHVDVAADSKTAQSLAIGEIYDVLVVDLGLPDHDGLNLIAGIETARSEGANTYFVCQANGG